VDAADEVFVSHAADKGDEMYLRFGNTPVIVQQPLLFYAIDAIGDKCSKQRFRARSDSESKAFGNPLNVQPKITGQIALSQRRSPSLSFF